jgi:hypothetical protein
MTGGGAETKQQTAPPEPATPSASTKPEEGFFRNYSNASLLSYIADPQKADPFELEVEAIREGRRRADSGTLGETLWLYGREAATRPNKEG